jgi:HD-like signal output (HDOD) protein
VLERARTIPALPQTALRVSEMMQDPNVSAAEVQRVIELDPGLTAEILRIANSAYFRGSGEIASIRDAVVRLGGRSIVQLVMTSAVTPLAGKPIKGYGMPAGALFDNAVGVALGVERMGQQLGVKPPAHAFTAGLLHDLGKIVLGTFMEVDGERIQALALENTLSFEQAEREVLGVDSPEVGAMLLEEWNVPQAIVGIVRWHKQPDRYDGDDPVSLDLVHVCDLVCRMSGYGMGLDGIHYQPSALSLRRLGLTTQVAEEVMGQLATDLEDVRNIVAGNGKE